MLKIIALSLIVSGFFSGGIYLASRQTKKVLVVSDVLLMLSVIETQIRYACLPVSDLLRVLCETEKLSSFGFISECKSKTDNGEDFHKAWKQSVENSRELCSLLGEYKTHLLRLGKEIGATDIDGQLGCCEYYKQIFEKELTLREENEKKYKKLYPLLGLMLGISAVIIIV